VAGDIKQGRTPRQDRRAQNHPAEGVGEGVRAGVDRQRGDEEHALGDQNSQ
jgi:hypothetical protein